jgi:glycosyltransferase involved in cell wall biosynthesis
MKYSSFKELRVAIVTHVFATGPSQELEEYLKNKVTTLMFVGHPFSFAKDIRSFYRIYKDGKLIKETEASAWKLPELLMYFKDLIYTIIWLIKSKKKIDIYIGADPLNAAAGIFLEKINKVSEVILYTIDYVPKRFKNPSLNWLYRQLDSYCVKNSNKVWNLSSKMAKEREKKGIPNDDKQIVVPIGVNFIRIRRLPISEINRKHVVYMGHLGKGKGLELIIQTLPKIVKKIPDIKLLIIGTGQLENDLRNMVKELGVSKNVEFKGFVKDHRDVENMLVKCAVGLAMYEPDSDSITQYTDPSKPKQYMACGLPVIITAVPWIAEEIEKKRMGIVINYDERELAEAVVKLLKDDEFYVESRENAINFASKLSWDQIFNNALFETLNSW